MKTAPASCAHYWMPILPQVPNNLALDVQLGKSIKLLIACPLCFRYATADFETLGFHLDAKTAREQRAARKGKK